MWSTTKPFPDAQSLLLLYSHWLSGFQHRYMSYNCMVSEPNRTGEILETSEQADALLDTKDTAEYCVAWTILDSMNFLFLYIPPIYAFFFSYYSVENFSFFFWTSFGLSVTPSVLSSTHAPDDGSRRIQTHRTEKLRSLFHICSVRETRPCRGASATSSMPDPICRELLWPPTVRWAWIFFLFWPFSLHTH